MVRGQLVFWLVGILLALTAQAVSAAPGFIASARVSEDTAGVYIDFRFNCKVSYQNHEPLRQSDSLRIYLEPTNICNGVSPLVARSHGRYRPINSDTAGLLDFEFDGGSAAGPILMLNFSEPVRFSIESAPVSFQLRVRIGRETFQAAPVPVPNQGVSHRQVIRPVPIPIEFAINLRSFRRIPTIADVPNLRLATNRRLFYTEVDVDGTPWFRLRVGPFATVNEARLALRDLDGKFQGAWIDRIDPTMPVVDLTTAARNVLAVAQESSPTLEALTRSRQNVHTTEVDRLMEDARATMISGDRSRAIQLYTKILQLPENPRQAEAQEYLALAREKNGQYAHAKAEYRRYLSRYPESEGAPRVNQRLAVLLANTQQGITGTAPGDNRRRRRNRANDWRLQTYFSQYYRRDIIQQADQAAIVSQSALYSDVNFDARRRGERFDFSSRLTLGYRSDFLDEAGGSTNDTRISYAYADLADAVTGLRGRIGRQSRNSGGILGRFDGINLGYQATERILVNTVVGKPAYSATDGIDSSRTFYGASLDYGPVWDGLELGLYFVQQNIEGISDRQAVGGEFRYFGANQSVWGMLDYDTQYQEMGSAFLQASWRFNSRLTINASYDKRRSPFLSAGNAIIGQPVATFAELVRIFSEEEIRQLSLDRSPVSTSYLAGMSYALSQKFQLTATASQTSVESTPESGGVLAMPATQYRYFASNLVASSLLKEGDVSIVGIQYSDSGTTTAISLTLDTRYPISRSLRVNPRLRVDRRERAGEANFEWIFTPGLRLQYRKNQRFRLELEAGKQFLKRNTEIINLDRESYFINLGYQVFF